MTDDTDAPAGEAEGAAASEELNTEALAAGQGAEGAGGDEGEGQEGEQGQGGEEPKPKRGSVAIQRRFDELTRRNTEAETRAREAEARADAATKLLEARGEGADATAFSEAEVNRRAEALAKKTLADRSEAEQVADFNKRSNDVFDAGVKAFGEDFQESVAALRMTGIVGPDNLGFVQTVYETDAPEAVLHHLGQDPDEAARLAAMPPIKMAVELTKLAAKLGKPKDVAVSGAPPPIKPLGGNAKPEINIYNPKLTDAEYRAARAKSGAPYARAL